MTESKDVAVRVRIETPYGLTNEECSDIENFLLERLDIAYCKFTLERKASNRSAEDGLGNTIAVWELSDKEMQ